ncbi:hypothetical protein HCN44_005012 [Aphidius gifuensis]|uniref:Metalloendopeptidase n=1 Tax=Aphidius gifuensis TaxID=684658 RepID=A0A834XSJ4_APHGI|nr:low choriolytic enzyme [Aphidius gifuensis]KAF7992668.1 hypothetical protein HCN44_005012 [Aphidius gifuensis]
MLCLRILVICLMVIKGYNGYPATSHKATHGHSIPPVTRFSRPSKENIDSQEIYLKIKSLAPEERQNAWEMSGLFEGDIMENKNVARNGLTDDEFRWPDGIVPVFINEDDFDQEDIAMIKAALKEYHEKTCLRFRAYNEKDSDYVVFQGSEAGCWSSVGRQGKEQVINLQNPGCMKHGTIVHEIMHAVGFYHQQSSFDRDEYVKIIWANIEKGKEHNFEKYDSNTVTDYGVGYDYQSVMHYSSKAFSKNGNMTIVPKKEDEIIGQRNGMSDKDMIKLGAMYNSECKKRDEKNDEEIITEITDSLTWLFD